MDTYSAPEKIGHYGGVPVYYDADNKNSVACCRGPIKDDGAANQGYAYYDMETGKITKADGSAFITKKSEYEIKFYIVGVKNMDEAIELIDKYNLQHYGKGNNKI